MIFKGENSYNMAIGKNISMAKVFQSQSKTQKLIRRGLSSLAIKC